ncbi:MAG: GMC family oxidoreductase [Myxococcales bacterium]|nr:GMC family oxidoreductase [Myxococcales bacterium]
MIFEHKDYAPDHIVDAEVVVVGTGAGGASIGAHLAEAGVDVVFVEEGGHHPTSSFNPYLAESLPRLWRDAGTTMIFGKSPFIYAEGRCVGGSTVINGAMTYRTPESVLSEWQAHLKAPELGPAAMDPWFATVEEDISARHQIPGSIGGDNRIMSLGAERSGWHHQKNTRNQDHCVGANNCVLGCVTGAKQSTLVSYMPRAFKAGARCLTEVRILSLRIENGRCTGVEGRVVDPRTRKLAQRVTVRAKAVVIACGAVQTPHLLLRHRLGRPSRQLGRNFVTHPNVKVLAVYPFDVRGWQGVSQWGQIREFHDQGIIFAENMVPAGAMAAALPAHGRRVWEMMRQYNNMVLSGILVEDTTTGVIRRGPFDTPLPFYSITPADQETFLRAVRTLGAMHFEMGAERLILPFTNLHEVTNADQLGQITSSRIKIRHMELFTPHLMGSARMGVDRKDSVVGLDGQLWDLPGCYISDASIFPSAIGVNPQVTIMALGLKMGARLAETVLRSRNAGAA